MPKIGQKLALSSRFTGVEVLTGLIGESVD